MCVFLHGPLLPCNPSLCLGWGHGYDPHLVGCWPALNTRHRPSSNHGWRNYTTMPHPTSASSSGTLCGARPSVSDSFPGVLAKDTLTLGKLTVGLGAARALRPQVGRPTAAICSKRRWNIIILSSPCPREISLAIPPWEIKSCLPAAAIPQQRSSKLANRKQVSCGFIKSLPISWTNFRKNMSPLLIFWSQSNNWIRKPIVLFFCSLVMW